MTPKEKAKELIQKFTYELFTPENGWFVDDKETKRFALLAVNELQIQAGNQKFGNYSAMQYWLDVETEIKKEL